MGIYDFVDIDVYCPICGEKLPRFQTKDGNPYLNTVDFRDVDNFYTSCDKCGAWIEFTYSPTSILKREIYDYVMRVSRVGER